MGGVIVPLKQTLTHYVSLKGFGGVEQQFAAFVQRVNDRSGRIQRVVVASRHIHAHHRPLLDKLDGWRFEKKCLGISLPKKPRFLRRARYRWLANHPSPDVALLWNRLGQQGRVLDALGPRRCLYWEHGSAWLAGEAPDKAAVLAQLPAVICNSHAAKRMLELHWNYKGTARVCLNGMRTSARQVSPKTRVDGRALHLGVACRLVPIKATCLALHTLAELRERGHDVRLSVAGDGPLRASLEALANTLGITPYVDFRGVVRDMAAFFDEIDILLHPALREPFGVVAAEAGAAGCPVVCTAVDGLPEVVEDGQTGRCVPATETLDRYRDLGGVVEGLPPVVYVPARDCVIAPQICEPAALADAVCEISASADTFARMSRAAIERVAQRFDFDRHVDQVLSAVDEYARTGTLRADP